MVFTIRELLADYKYLKGRSSTLRKLKNRLTSLYSVIESRAKDPESAQYIDSAKRWMVIRINELIEELSMIEKHIRNRAEFIKTLPLLTDREKTIILTILSKVDVVIEQTRHLAELYKPRKQLTREPIRDERLLKHIVNVASVTTPEKAKEIITSSIPETREQEKIIDELSIAPTNLEVRATQIKVEESKTLDEAKQHVLNIVQDEKTQEQLHNASSIEEVKEILDDKPTFEDEVGTIVQTTDLAPEVSRIHEIDEKHTFGIAEQQPDDGFTVVTSKKKKKKGKKKKPQPVIEEDVSFTSDNPFDILQDENVGSGIDKRLKLQGGGILNMLMDFI